MGKQDEGAGDYRLDELSLAVAHFSDTPLHSIEGKCFFTFNPIENTRK
jgi:hypothetical protein